MKGAGTLVGNFELNPLKKIDLGVVQTFLTLKIDYVKTQTYESSK